MDTTNATPVTASDLLGHIRQLGDGAKSQRAALERAHTAVINNSVAGYYETKPDFEARQASHQSELDYQERLSNAALAQLDRAMKPLRERLEGPSGLGLTPTEWEKAGALSGLMTSRISGASLTVAIGEVQSALAGNDRPRLAAAMAAAEQRLREQPARDTTDRVPLRWREDMDRLRSVIADARGQLRDTTLDIVRERYAELVGVAGDLGATLYRRRAERALQAQLDSGERVAFPPREVGSDGRVRFVGADGVAR